MTQNYLTEEEMKKYIANERIFFARIVELPQYAETNNDAKEAKKHSEETLKNSTYGDLPVGEIANFLPRDDGYTYGYVEPKTKSKEAKDDFLIQKIKERETKKFKIERIDDFYFDKDQIDNCLVIFISIKTNKIIGYYKDATIYREVQKNPNYKYKNNVFLNSNNEIFYNMKTKNGNAILLYQRLIINNGKDLHSGQSSIKYYDNKNKNFVKKVLLPNLLIIK